MSTSSSLRETLLQAAGRLEEAGVDSPRLSAEVLLALAFDLERSELLRRLIVEPEAPLATDVRERFAAYLERRAGGEPVAYITGVKEFYGREFRVGPDVLIPRPETELLIDVARQYTPSFPRLPLFADFGTGSGCIAVTLALELRGSSGVALDRSAAALGVARDNARRLGTEAVHFVRADFRRVPLADACLHFIAANPPYIGGAEYQALDREVRAFEPKSALVPEENDNAAGTEDAFQILREAARLLVPGGVLLMEMGCGQGPELLHALPGALRAGARVLRDAAGLDRLLVAVKQPL
jgi:release factor glutamine methyltransferase